MRGVRAYLATIQGEGPYCGRLCSFIRLGHCNLSCSWCDTRFSWDHTRYDVAKECPDRTWSDVVNEVVGHRTPIVVVSGGEPLMHQRKPGFQLLLATLTCHPHNRAVHVETNGTIAPNDVVNEYVAHVSVSPKLANSGDPAAKRIKSRAIEAFRDRAWARTACFKFVAATPADLHEVEDLVLEYGLPPESVWIMPEGNDPELMIEHHRAIAEAVLAHGWNTTTRLHTLLWGSERAR